MKKYILLTAVAGLAMSTPSISQIVGTFDNFDCVNDTGETAEGFEIEIEDVMPADITRAFPSNFTSQPYVNRFGIPDITAYDNTGAGGHKGVKVTWHANWDGAKWVAKYGDYVQATTASGHGVLYRAKPAATQGEQCWLLGQGVGYATSGCEHFGISYAAGALPGKVTYHWLVPDKTQTGTLIQAPWVSGAGPIAPVPVYAYVAPAVVGAPPVVHAVAQAPEKPDPLDPQFGPARWVKTYTSFSKVHANLDLLQANVVPRRGKPGSPVRITWDVVQKPPAGAAAEAMEKEAVDDDGIDGAKGFVSVVKRYEYYDYTGVYDPETHEAICAPEPKGANGPCTQGPKNYTYVDPVTGASRKVKEKGKFLGAHNDAVDL